MPKWAGEYHAIPSPMPKVNNTNIMPTMGVSRCQLVTDKYHAKPHYKYHAKPLFKYHANNGSMRVAVYDSV